MKTKPFTETAVKATEQAAPRLTKLPKLQGFFCWRISIVQITLNQRGNEMAKISKAQILSTMSQIHNI